MKKTVIIISCLLTGLGVYNLFNYMNESSVLVFTQTGTPMAGFTCEVETSQNHYVTDSSGKVFLEEEDQGIQTIIILKEGSNIVFNVPTSTPKAGVVSIDISSDGEIISRSEARSYSFLRIGKKDSTSTKVDK